MTAQFKTKEISVRERLNALDCLPAQVAGKQDKYNNDAVGKDIGGGEVQWPDGSITGGNSNGTYTKWPNGVVEVIMEKNPDGIAVTDTLGETFQSGNILVYTPLVLLTTSYLSAEFSSQSGAEIVVSVLRIVADLSYVDVSNYGLRVQSYVSLTLGTAGSIKAKAIGTWK